MADAETKVSKPANASKIIFDRRFIRLEYIVRPRETLSGIANIYGISTICPSLPHPLQ
jgi:hypothetical protein